MKMTKAEIVASLDDFTKGYLGAALLCEELDHLSISDFTVFALAQATGDCARFQADNAKDLKAFLELYDEQEAGLCFWLTSRRHGSGFWDMDYAQGELAEAYKALTPVVTRLTEASHAYSENGVSLYRGKVYLD